MTSSCNEEDETLSDIVINEMIIDGVGNFDYEDNLNYAAVDSIEYRVNISTTPANANIYYKTEDSDFTPLNTDWILIDSSTSKLFFYAELEGYNSTQVKSIDFSFENDSLNVNIYPYATSGLLNIEINNNTRGVLSYNIYDRMGNLKITKQEAILGDTFLFNDDLSEFDAGLYFLKLNYGETKLVKKIMKQD